MNNLIPAETAERIANCLFAGRKIQAIKLYREYSGQALKQSKEFVESLEASLRAQQPGRFMPPSGKSSSRTLAAVTLAISILLLIKML